MQHLIDHDVYPEGYDDVRNQQESCNLNDINASLTLSRASLSLSRFTREDFLKFKKINREALTENKMMSKMFRAGKIDIPSQENLRLINLKDLIDDSIIKAQPDVYDRIRSEE